MRNDSFVAEINSAHRSGVFAKGIRILKGLRSLLEANLSGLSIGEE
jgi:hypothetical protein